MKITLLILLTLTGVVTAATINVGNLNDFNNTNGITLSSGTSISSGGGSVQVGYFNGVTDVTGASLSDLVSSYNPYGNLINFGAGLNLAAVFQGAINGPALDGTSFANKTLYLVITNSTAGFTALGITSATEILIWNPSLSFPATETFTASINVQNGAGALVRGGYNNYSIDFGGGPVAAYNLVAIPEPSTLMLSALGVCVILRRRR